MFKRLYINDLINWKNSQNRKPLVLRGARQVGKTTLIKQFSTEFNQFIHLNLENKQHKNIQVEKIKAGIEDCFMALMNS